MLRVIEWFHAAMIFVLIVPIIFLVGGFYESTGSVQLYLKCLLIAVPIVVTGIAAERSKTLAGYLIICSILTIVVWYITGIVMTIWSLQGESALVILCYRIAITAETVLIVGARFQNRLRIERQKKEEGTYAVFEESLLDKPSLSTLWYFVVVYVIGLVFSGKYLCDMAFFSMIAYLFPTLLYLHIQTTERYRGINKRTSGISGKRLYAVSSGMLLLYCLLLFIAVIPAVFLLGNRHYINLKDLLEEYKLPPIERAEESEFESAGTGMGAVQMIFDDAEPAPEPSIVVNIVMWGIGAACVVLAIYAVIRAIRQIFADFRREIDENGDKVEELDEMQYQKEKIFILRRHEHDSEAARIKRLYKKTIRSHRKDRPAPYESPAEIEQNAGLGEDEQMQALHNRYEEVRYRSVADER